MLNIKFNTAGCFIGILVLLFLTFLLKFWFVILLAIVVFVIYINLKKVIKSDIPANSKFVSKPGKVYKECSYCKIKAERGAISCNSCGRPFE